MTIKKLQHIVGVLKDGLVSIYLYQKSLENIPVFIVNDVDLVLLDSIRPFFAREKFIILTQDDIKEGNDVFCLKLLHIKNHSKLFYGNDVLGNFSIKISDLRSALELEIRTKHIQLREDFLSQNKGRDFLHHLLPGMQILREGMVYLKNPTIILPQDIKELLSLFDIAWSCNSQNFYYLIDDRVEDSKIPFIVNDVHNYLSELCTKVNNYSI